MRNIPWRALLFSFVILSFITAGCAGNPSPQTLTNRAESLWNSQKINTYVIEVSQISSTWHSQTHVITVEGGVVVDFSATCITAPMETALGKECVVEAFDPDDFSVPGLFSTVRDLLKSQPKNSVTIKFDPDYGFPAHIIFDQPEVVDEDQVWLVRDFQLRGENQD